MKYVQCTINQRKTSSTSDKIHMNLINVDSIVMDMYLYNGS
jgi:hypothetical protein